MRKTLKRMTAIMLSLLMILGCVPNFINEASAVEKVDYIDLVSSGSFSDDGATYKVDYADPTDADKYSLNISMKDTETQQEVTDEAHDGKKYSINIEVQSKPGYSIMGTPFRLDGWEISYHGSYEKWYCGWDVYARDYVSVDYTEPECVDDIKAYPFGETIHAGRGRDSYGYCQCPWYLINGNDHILMTEIDYGRQMTRDMFSTIQVNGTDVNVEVTGPEEISASNPLGYCFDTTYLHIYKYYNFAPNSIIESVSASGDGILSVGETPNLHFATEANDQYTVEDDAETNKWYENYETWMPLIMSNCLTDEVSAITEKGKKLYRLFSVKAKKGYCFDYSIIPTVNVTGGTIESTYVKDEKELLVLVSATTTGKTVSINYTKPATYNAYNSFSNANYTYSGLTNAPTKSSNGLSTLLSNNSYKGIYLLETNMEFTSPEEAASVEQLLFRGQNVLTDENKTTAANHLDYIKTHDIGWYISGAYLVLMEKLDFSMKENITFTQAPDMTVADVKASVTNSEGTLFGSNIYPIDDSGITLDSPLTLVDKLENGKKYKLILTILAIGKGDLFNQVKVNNTALDYNSELALDKEGWKASTNQIDVNYTFECKNQSSGGGHKKKKVEEPKEDPKTPEEKLQEELLKDDVKKANSKEGEKINPTAKYINGYDDGTFKANNNVSNIELMSMVTELFDNVELKDKLDLNQGENYWGQEIIDKANALGLVPGNKDDKNYNLMGDVTRGDLAVVVYNLIKDYSNAPSISSRNNCHDAIGKNYEKEAAKLLELGIFKGYDDGMFHGDYTLTRAEAVVVINRALKSLGFEINMPKITLSFPDLTPDHWAYAEIMYAANK